MRNFRFTFIALASVLVLAAAFYITPEYMRKALFYQFPDIDDYKIFDNRTVIAGSYRPWKISEDAANKSLTADQEKDLEQYKTVADAIDEFSISSCNSDKTITVALVKSGIEKGLDANRAKPPRI